MDDRRRPVAVLALGVVVVVALIWALGRADDGDAPGTATVALVCGVPVSLFAETPRALDDSQASREVRGDPSLIGGAIPKLWRMYEVGDERRYVGGQPPTVHVTSLQRDGARWKWASGGGCTTFVEPPGRSSALWAIPSIGVDRTASIFEVMAADRQCASGRSAEERVGQAEVVETDSTVTVTFTASRPEGEFQNCPGHANAKRTVELRAPLGERTLLDGGIFPAQPPCIEGAATEQAEYCRGFFYRSS
ncbi:MAG: hypothetical protein Q8K63_13405 [Acidimicrobiales bacterium]|nr:hypothetical protein [Acidimicrobiales bacterium]